MYFLQPPHRLLWARRRANARDESGHGSIAARGLYQVRGADPRPMLQQCRSIRANEPSKEF